MPSIALDNFNNSTLWTSSNPGVLTLADDAGVHADLGDTASLRVEVGAGADGAFLERSIAPGALDLTPFPELRLWFRSSVPAGGADQPLRLRMQIGSAAMQIGAVGNDWHRYLPAPQADRFHFVRLSLDDLDPLVASAMDTVRFTVTNSAAAWAGWLDGLLACRPQLVADVDQALVGLLNNQLVLTGPVPAAVHAPGGSEPTEPWIRLVHYDAQYADRRASGRRSRTDFTDAGYRLGAEALPYDLDYRVEAVSSERDEQAALIEFALSVLGPRRTLLVNGTQVPLERLMSTARDKKGDAPVLRYRVSAWQDRGAAQPVAPVGDVALQLESTGT